jgi:hypothetical protein
VAASGICPISLSPSRSAAAAPGLESMRFEAVGLPILARDGVSVWVLLGLFHLV